MTAISMSVDPESRDNYGPYVPGVGAICPSTKKPIRFNNIPDLEAALEAHGKETAAFIVEPIQGEAGVVVPADDYLSKAHELCKNTQRPPHLRRDPNRHWTYRTNAVLGMGWY